MGEPARGACPREENVSRKCGACTLCCTTMAVPELDKPNGVPCKHLTPTGCGIYETRPLSCRAFECSWLRGDGDPTVRPDKTGAVMTLEDGGAGPDGTAVVMYTVPGDERWRRSKYLQKVTDRAIRRGSGTFVVAGDKRTLFTAPGSKLMRALQKLEENEQGKKP